MLSKIINLIFQIHARLDEQKELTEKFNSFALDSEEFAEKLEENTKELKRLANEINVNATSKKSN